MRQLTDQVYVFPFLAGFLNIYLIETPDGLLLVDTGMSPAQIDRIAVELQQAGRSLTDIRHIFITHAHTDHIDGLNHLQKLLPPTARTYAHRREAGIIRGEAPMLFADPAKLDGMQRMIQGFIPSAINIPSRVDAEIKEGDKIAGMLEVIELPGHAYGHCGLLWREKRILFGGDVMMHIPLRGLTRPFKVASPDPDAVIASIRKVADLNLQTLCVCHGAPLTENTTATIQAFARKFAGYSPAQ